MSQRDENTISVCRITSADRSPAATLPVELRRPVAVADLNCDGRADSRPRTKAMGPTRPRSRSCSIHRATSALPELVDAEALAPGCAHGDAGGIPAEGLADRPRSPGGAVMLAAGRSNGDGATDSG